MLRESPIAKWSTNIILIIVIILMLCSLFSIWWFRHWEGHYDNKEGYEIKGEEDFDFELYEVDYRFDGYLNRSGSNHSGLVERSYSLDEFTSSHEITYGDFTEIFKPVFLLLMITIIILILTLLVNNHKFSQKKKLSFLIASFISSIIAPVYFVIAFQFFLTYGNQYFPTDSFIGYKSNEVNDVFWGPGMGWYLSVIGAALLLILILVKINTFRKKSKQEDNTNQ